MEKPMSTQAIDGKTLTPITADSLRPLVGQKVTLLIDGEITVRTITVDSTPDSLGYPMEQFLGLAISRSRLLATSTAKRDFSLGGAIVG
jgi:hypothetical protein